MDNYFGGASQFAGGGFMPSPAVGNEGNYGMDGKQRKSGASGNRTESIRAITVHQLLSQVQAADDDTYLLDNAPLTNVSLVGRIVNVNENATRIMFSVHDGTGVVEMVMHVQDDDELFQARKRELVVNTYVRAYGALRRNGQHLGMTAYNMRPLQDFNEIAYHNLQVIFQHLHQTKGAPGSAHVPGMGGPAGTAVPSSHAPASTHAYGAPATAPATGAARSGDLNSDVLQVLTRVPKPPTGLTVQDVEQHLTSNGMHYNSAQVKAAITFLINEGHLYTTVDEHHFLPADS